MNENITLFFRDIIFADLRTLYTFRFEVKLYKYVVLRRKKSVEVDFTREMWISFGAFLKNHLI